MENEITLIHAGESFFASLSELFAKAQEEIHLQTYRLADDATGQLVAESLKAAAERGVRVLVLLDAYGSGSLSEDFVGSLRGAGIKVRFFSPLFTYKGRFFGRRLHHKIALCDREAAIIGGINIADAYRGNEKEKPWLDFAVHLRGNICRQVHDICTDLWEKKPISGISFMGRRYFPSHRSNHRTKIIHNDWFRYKTQVDSRYRQSVRNARSSVLIVASYFLPGIRFRYSLDAAVKRGVSVKLILAGQSDVPFLRHASLHLYNKLLDKGIEIYEWKESILHAKLMVVDEAWCTLGSFNLNYLSTYGSIETNVESRELALLNALCRQLNAVAKGCDKITREEFLRKNSLIHRFRNRVAYHMMRWAFFIMTFFTFKRLGETTIRE